MTSIVANGYSLAAKRRTELAINRPLEHKIFKKRNSLIQSPQLTLCKNAQAVGTQGKIQDKYDI